MSTGKILIVDGDRPICFMLPNVFELTELLNKIVFEGYVVTHNSVSRLNPLMR